MKKLTILSLITVFLLSIALVQAMPTISVTTPSGSLATEGENFTATVTITGGTGPFTISSNKTVNNITYTSATQAVISWPIGFDEAKTANPTDDANKMDFSVSVLDNNGDSAQGAVTATLKNTNRAPTAAASVSTPADINATITLNGGASTDPDSDVGDTVDSYTWTPFSDNPATVDLTLIDNGKTATFATATAGTYMFNLTVSDGELSSTPVTTQVVVQEPERLIISDLDIKVGSSTDSNIQGESDGYKISKDAEPGDRVIIDIELENTFDEDVEIEDVEVEVTIVDIDDNDNLDEDAGPEDIKDGRNEDFKLEFEVPERVDEGTYDIIIEISGRDTRGRSYNIVRTFGLEVDKESHDTRITRSSFENDVLSCRRTTDLTIQVVNFGSDNEEEIRITAKSSELDLSFEEWDDGDIELDTGVDDDAEHNVIVPINAIDVAAGSYPIEVQVFRDETKLEDTKSVSLTVEKCADDEPVVDNTPRDETNNQDDNVEVTIRPPAAQQPVTPPATGTPQFPVVREDNGDDNSFGGGYLILLGIAAVVLIALIIVVVVLLLKK